MPIAIAAMAVPAIISGLGALSGWLGGRPKTSQQTQTGVSNRTATTAMNMSRMPQYSPEDLATKNYLTQQYRNSLLRDIDLSGYTAGGIRNINQTGDIRNTLLRNTLAAKGLSYSPSAVAAQMQSENQRLGEVTNFRNTIPLMAEKLRQEKLDALRQFFAGLPYGTTESGTQTTNESGTTSATGTSTTPDTSWADMISGLGQGLAQTAGFDWALGQQNKYPNLQNRSMTPQMWEQIQRMLGYNQPRP